MTTFSQFLEDNGYPGDLATNADLAQWVRAYSATPVLVYKTAAAAEAVAFAELSKSISKRQNTESR